MVQLTLMASVRELQRYCAIPSLSHGQRNHVHLLWIRLREIGFTSKEISSLCKGKWSYNTIKKATRNTEIKSLNEKNELMLLLGKMADQDIEIDSVKTYLQARKVVDNESFSDLAALKMELARNGLTAQEGITGLTMLRTQNRTVEEVLGHSNQMYTLQTKGWTMEVMDQLITLIDIYDGLGFFLESFHTRFDLRELSNMVLVEQNKLNVLKNECNALTNEWDRYHQAINMLTKLILKNYSVENILSVCEAAEKFGDLDDVFEAINAFDQIYTINHRIHSLMDISVKIEQKNTRLRKETIEIIKNQVILTVAPSLLPPPQEQENVSNEADDTES